MIKDSVKTLQNFEDIFIDTSAKIIESSINFITTVIDFWLMVENVRKIKLRQ